MFCPACWYYEKFGTKLAVRGPEELHYREHERIRNDKETSNAERTTG